MGSEKTRKARSEPYEPYDAWLTRTLQESGYSTKFGHAVGRAKIPRALAEDLGVPFIETENTDSVQVEVHHHWLIQEHPASPAWTVAFRLVIQGGQPVIAEVRLFPTEARGASELRP